MLTGLGQRSFSDSMSGKSIFRNDGSSLLYVNSYYLHKDGHQSVLIYGTSVPGLLRPITDPYLIS